MTIGPGSRIGPYEVAALIGGGGMGRVWRAHHTALKRDDALKVLPDAYDVSPNGERFLMIKDAASPLKTSTPPSIIVVQGWFEELKRRVPTK